MRQLLLLMRFAGKIVEPFCCSTHAQTCRPAQTAEMGIRAQWHRSGAFRLFGGIDGESIHFNKGRVSDTLNYTLIKAIPVTGRVDQ
jgi:hypothetical protein